MEAREIAEPGSAAAPESRRIGVVVHPTRGVERPLQAIRQWTAARGAELGQVQIGQRQVAETTAAEDCQLIVSIGGDGTMLAAMRAAAAARRPVLGVACGSLGALTSVEADGDRVRDALERFERGDWIARRLPALEARQEGEEPIRALNDIAVVRAGQGQIRTSAVLDGALFARFAGDGAVISTAVGSSAYALGAGGPLFAPGASGFLLTPLTVHGGFCPPLVIGSSSRLELDVDASHAGTRVEVDGQVREVELNRFDVMLREDAVSIVTFEGQESPLAGLRRREIIIDSARILAEDRRRR